MKKPAWMDKQKKQQRRRATQIGKSILFSTRKLGLVFRSSQGKRKGRTQRVRFKNPCYITQDGMVVYRIDVPNLPTGVSTNDLRRDDLLTLISDACDAPIYVERIANETCFISFLNSSRFPKTVPINTFDWGKAETIDGISHTDIPSLSFPLGMNDRGKYIYADLHSLKHLLIGGTSGAGKSTLLHNIILAIVERNTPRSTQFWLGDIKKTELSLYKPLHKKYIQRIATTPSDIISMLLEAATEMKTRQIMQEKVGAVNMKRLREKTGLELPYIIIIIDEIMDLMLSKEKIIAKNTIRNEAEALLSRIASQGRSSGVHLVVATQVPSSDVITTLIKGNIPTAIAFNVADRYKAESIIGNPSKEYHVSPVGVPKGRCVFKAEDGRYIELQTCFISDKQIELQIDRLAHGTVDNEKTRKLLDDCRLVIVTSRDKCHGLCSRDKIYAFTKQSLSRDRVQDIILILEQEGIIEMGMKGKPRRVFPAFLQNPSLIDALPRFNAIRDPARDLAATPPRAEEHIIDQEGDSGLSDVAQKHPGCVRAILHELENSRIV